jgi:predicted 3-demethylubiquinone-9 3-methyltransferase (glyoxalase superfamily)
MSSITTFLTFKTQAEDAAKFYTSIFPNSRITQVTHYPDFGPQFPFPEGTVMTVSFELDGREFVALNGGPQFAAFTEAFSISVVCDTQAQVDRYWEQLLQDGGKPVACGWLTDKFGVSWQITPKILMDAIANPDRAKARDAMSVMMTMVKIDAEQIKRALAT